MSKNSAKSLTKTAVLDASDNPDDQDEARKRRVKMDFASWRKQTKAGKTTHQEEVGISSSAEMKKAKKEAELQKKEAEAVKKVKKEEVVLERSLSSDEEDDKERIVKGMKKDKKGFKARYGKDAESVMYATATKLAKEDWKPEIEVIKGSDLRKKAKKEKESKLPPHLQGDAIGKMKKAFAHTNEEVELSEQWVDSAIDVSTEYFFHEGLNPEGVELVIEEVGLDDFVEFVLDPIEELNEERSARKAKVSAPSYEKVKAAVDKADKAKKASGKGEYAKSYAKRSGETEDSTNYDDKAPVKKKAPAKKAPAKKVTVRKVTPTKKAATKKKVTASVAKAKTKQPLKPTSKKGIRGAIERGVARHKAAVGKAKKEVGKVVKTAKATAKQHSKHRKDFVKGITPTPKEKKIAKGVGKVVKKALTREELERLEALAEKKKKPSVHDDYYDPMEDPTFDPHEAEATRGQSGRGTKGKMNVRKKYPVKEARDRAFDNVVAKLRAQHGKDAVLTKDSPKPKPQPRQKPKPDTRSPEQKKKDQEQANIDARYGGRANRLAGRGLGT